MEGKAFYLLNGKKPLKSRNFDSLTVQTSNKCFIHRPEREVGRGEVICQSC
jgi:hypothetical protein